jgi:hypothetical protein
MLVKASKNGDPCKATEWGGKVNHIMIQFNHRKQYHCFLVYAVGNGK